MTKESYQGWKNRSTWAASLHLNNTNEEIYLKFIKVSKDYSKAIHEQKELDKEHSYSFPKFQKKEYKSKIYSLLKKTLFFNEENVSFEDIDFEELAID